MFCFHFRAPSCIKNETEMAVISSWVFFEWTSMKCWECCCAGISQRRRDTHYLGHLTESLCLSAALGSITELLKSVRNQACVCLLSDRKCCGWTEGLFAAWFTFFICHRARGSHQNITRQHQRLRVRSSPNLRTTNSLCLHCGDSPQVLVGWPFFSSNVRLSIAALFRPTTMAYDPFYCLLFFLFYPPCPPSWQQNRHGSSE